MMRCGDLTMVALRSLGMHYHLMNKTNCMWRMSVFVVYRICLESGHEDKWLHYAKV